MKISKKAILLVVLGFLEMIFLTVHDSFFDTVRVPELRVAKQFRAAPSPENYDALMKEHQITLNRSRRKEHIENILIFGNLALMIWLIWKRPAVPPPESQASRNS